MFRYYVSPLLKVSIRTNFWMLRSLRCGSLIFQSKFRNPLLLPFFIWCVWPTFYMVNEAQHALTETMTVRSVGFKLRKSTDTADQILHSIQYWIILGWDYRKQVLFTKSVSPISYLLPLPKLREARRCNHLQTLNSAYKSSTERSLQHGSWTVYIAYNTIFQHHSCQSSWLE